MTIRTLAEVGARLEEAFKATSGESDSPIEIYERYEELAIQILDSEFDDFPENVLLEYLTVFMKLKEMELGLPDREIIK